MDGFALPFVVLLGGVVVSRVITERALRKLDAEEKAKLIDSFSFVRQFNLLGVVAIVLLGFYSLVLMQFLLPVYVVVLGAHSVVRLRSLDLPSEYTRPALAGMAVMYGAIGVFWLWMLLA